MGQVIISVIVPVYNAEAYIEQCIVSILDQSLKEIEVIIVNDGSTDSSKDIILKYCKKDDRIVFVDSVNKGVSAARNAGIKIARGAYIGFVDADDYAEPLMYETLYAVALKHKAGLVICNASMVENGIKTRPRLHLQDEVITTGKNTGGMMVDFLRFKYDFANWNKIYSAPVIQKHGILFDEAMSMWEDILFNLTCIQFAETVVVLKEPLYNYRLSTGSIMTSTNNGFSRYYNLFYQRFVAFCKRNVLNDQLIVFKQELSQNAIPTIILFIFRSAGLKPGFKYLLRNLRYELRELNPEIYLFDKKQISYKGIKGWLLQGKRVSAFSLFYLLELQIKNKLRPFKHYMFQNETITLNFGKDQD